MLAQLPPALQNLQLPLRLKLWDGHQFDLGPQPRITIIVKDPQLVAQFSHPTLDLLGSAFVEGQLELEGSVSEVVRICDELSQALLNDEDDHQVPRQSHDKATDAASISYHYDLSNAFYQLWLDRDMVYSCAYFETANVSLEAAQQAKFRHLCRKLRLQPGDYLLDVGCGWGGLDYRDLPQDARFDKVVSVGMFEHVGHANLRSYSNILFGAVREGGLVLNHGITAKHTDGRPVGRGAGDFIDRYVFPNGELRYVFPNGELPHLSMISAAVSEVGLEVVDVESLRLHYAKTLNQWSQRLENNLDAAARLVPEKALRIWRLYLAGCERLDQPASDSRGEAVRQWQP